MLRILIVEDEPMIARNLQQMLSAKKYVVSGIAYDQSTALDKLAQQNTDLVLLDINLNGQFEGLEIAQTIQAKYHIPFIFITSYADEEVLNNAKITRPSGYIVKPFEEREIYATIEIAWYNHSQKEKDDISIELINAKIVDPLTTKEYDVLNELLAGKPYQEIADSHHISINTVNTHVKNIYSKLDIHSRGEALQRIKSLR